MKHETTPLPSRFTPPATTPRLMLGLYAAALFVTVFGLPFVATALQPVDQWLLKRVAGAAAQVEARQGNRY